MKFDPLAQTRAEVLGPQMKDQAATRASQATLFGVMQNALYFTGGATLVGFFWHWALLASLGAGAYFWYIRKKWYREYENQKALLR